MSCICFKIRDLFAVYDFITRCGTDRREFRACCDWWDTDEFRELLLRELYGREIVFVDRSKELGRF
jgi:hypothetical protein